jgi:REP element-mobilizing transposase RayT
MAHPPRIPVWLPLEKPVIYFVTWCVEHRRPVLANAEAFSAFRNSIRKLTGWQIDAAVLMPDHVHILAWPRHREEPIGDLSALVKRWMRQELKAEWKWQPGCFDRLLRTNESAQEKWEYMRENPVRAGLVNAWQDWPYQIGFRPPHGL